MLFDRAPRLQPSESNSGGSHQIEISTDPVRKVERFDYYCELARSNYLGFDISTKAPGEFYGRMSGLAASSATLTRTELSPVTWTRTRRSILDRDDSLILMQMESGSGQVVQAGEELPLTPGAFALYLSTMPSEIRLFQPNVRWSIKLPRDRVEIMLAPGSALKQMSFAANDTTMSLLFDYVRSYSRSGENMSPRGGEIVAKHIAEMIALAVGASRDAQAELANGGLKAARINAILMAISENHSSPFISPASIGASLGISERHVHRLLEETSRTFYEHLLEARLSNAYRALIDWRTSDRAISAIASAAGFTNLSYFSREFRTRFGDTPTGTRRGRGGPSS